MLSDIKFSVMGEFIRATILNGFMFPVCELQRTPNELGRRFWTLSPDLFHLWDRAASLILPGLTFNNLFLQVQPTRY